MQPKVVFHFGLPLNQGTEMFVYVYVGGNTMGLNICEIGTGKKIPSHPVEALKVGE